MGYLIKSKELVDEMRKFVALNVLYGTGFQLEYVTKSRVNSKATKYPKEYNAKNTNASYYPQTMKEHLLANADKNRIAADCCGLVKGIKYGRRANDISASYKASMDVTIKVMADECTDVTTDVSKAVEGMFMWFNDDYSHCAIYTGNGKDVESAPSLDGVKEVPIKYQANGKRWSYGKLPWVDYSDSKPAPTPSPTTKIEVGCKVTIASGAVYGGSAKGVKVPPEHCNKPYTVDKVETHSGVEEARIKELVSWVATKYLTRVNQVSTTSSTSAPKTTSKTVYNCSALNVRSGPGTSYKVVSYLKCGDKVTVYATSGTWSRIGDGRWCSSKYLK